MSTFICPNCKFHNTDFDLVCFKCGHVFTPEEREQLAKEHEMYLQHDVHKTFGEHHHEHKVQKKLTQLSFGIFKVGFAEMLVPVIIVLVLIIFAFLMFLK